MLKKCIIYGAGKYGQVYAKYLEEEYCIQGFIDDNPALIGQSIENNIVLGNRDYSFEYLRSNPEIDVFVPLGDNDVRFELMSKYNELGFSTPSFIHRSAIVHESAFLGKGIYIETGSIIMPFARIDDFSMLCVGVNIAHHTVIDKGCFFSMGANVGASINIHQKVYVGIGATLMTGVEEIGKNALIGAGANVIRNVPENAIMVGCPAKVLRYK